MMLGTTTTLGLLLLVQGNLRSAEAFQGRDLTYYSAKAAVEVAMADLLAGQDIALPGYTPSPVTLNGVTSTVSVQTPAGSYRPKLVYRYIDPGASTALASLPGGGERVVKIEGVQPFSTIGMSWAFDDSFLPHLEMVIEDSTGAVIARDEQEDARTPFQLIVRSGTDTRYTIRFINRGNSPVASLSFSSLGGLDHTWVLAKASGREYILRADTVGGFGLKAYVRQIPGPDQVSPVPQVIVVETWRSIRLGE